VSQAYPMTMVRHITASSQPSVFAAFRLPPEVIVRAVRLHLRSQSYRDVQELLAERVSKSINVTVYQWVQRSIPLLTEAAHPRPGPLVGRRDLT
jgi:transposase-like protein